ncbi:MAG: RagB/SusD family nutrient uptake outer membrane protein [Cytophagales bacterium]|nr:RagB/SusD family nutrient uptake outer membrane protein [Cytophagales bacterium]
MKNQYKSIRNLSVRLGAIFIMFFTYTSCDDILEEDPVSLATADSYYSTALGIQDGLKACYPFLRSYYGEERSFYLTVVGTDINTNGFGGNKNNPSFNNYDQNLLGTHSFFRQIWDPFYEGINQCNTMIGRAPDVPDMSDEEKNLAIAEAKFLRAHYYFILVQIWGDVHFTLEETVGAETEAYRTSVKTIYDDGIVPDLKFAIQHLPDPSETAYGRANKATSESLLARVQLTLGNWGEAEQLANNVMSNYNFALEDLDKLWDLENQRNSEVIWSVQYSSDPLVNGNGNKSHNFFVWDYTRNPAMDRDIENGKPHQRFMPTNYFLNLWDVESDARFDASFKTVWIANKSATINGNQVNPGDTAIKIVMHPVDDAIQESAPYWYIDYNGEDVTNQTDPWQIGGDSRRRWPSFYKKYYDNKRSAVNAQDGSRDFVVIRLAEMYLIAAEAAFNQSRNDDAAIHINNLRQRAIKPGREAEMLVVPEDIDLNFILEERARELGGEGHRWFDLKRTGTLLDRVKMYNPDAAPNIKEMHLVRPIPQNQIDRVSNPGDFLQNPGY